MVKSSEETCIPSATSIAAVEEVRSLVGRGILYCEAVSSFLTATKDMRACAYSPTAGKAGGRPRKLQGASPHLQTLFQPASHFCVSSSPRVFGYGGCMLIRGKDLAPSNDHIWGNYSLSSYERQDIPFILITHFLRAFTMATVDLNHDHFWQPPKPSLHYQHTLPRKHSRTASATTSRNQPVAATRQRGRDFEARPEDEEVVLKLLDPLLRKEIAATGCQGTRDRPVILEEDEGDTPDHTTHSEATSTCANTRPVPAFELSQFADPSNREPWWDVEEGCFVYEDLHLLPSLDHEGLVSTLAQDQPPSRRHSLGVSQDQTKPHGDNRTTRSASEESAAQSLIITLGQDGGGESEESVSDLERDMQLAFEEQEELLATSPSSPRCRSFESSQPPIDQDCDRSWSEELRSSTRLCSQEMDMEGPREQEQEEMAGNEIRHKVLEQELEQDLEEADDDDESERLEQRGEKRQYQDGGIKTGIHDSESSGHGYDINDDDDEDDEEDENLRLTKQRRLFLATPDMLLTPLLEQSLPKPCLARARSATPSSTTHLEIGNVQSQTDLARPRQ
ncbi:hypothetical protein BKA65DRAFT_485675 [Rhexocercosporidium sp. MPI-PUGE-AT-0058]|nr:hypothetical protein BKA65DRAFT_485675 [Rhexocercosporidium sp. MPI-PUGE-AT-0058]